MTKSNSSPDLSTTLLKMESIGKDFGKTRALDNVDFELKSGEVHALIGENGAGKSTLVKILSGAVNQDTGRIFLEDQPFSFRSPLECRRSGISMIYQELNLAPHLTVAENIMLGKESRKWSFINRRDNLRSVRKTLEFLGHTELDPDKPVMNLSIGQKQIVEIARALVDRAKILIMDEPTSSLSLEDTQRLFQIIRTLKDEGVSIIYISHFLEEVRSVADRYTVLRDGRKIGTGSLEVTSLDEIIQMMVGQKLTEMFPKVPHSIGEEVLRLNEFRGRRMASSVSFSLRRGEILGFAGLIGAGRTDVLRTVFGLDAIENGTLDLEEGGNRSIGNTPWARINQGLGYLSEDRQGEGLALSLAISDNIALSRFSPYVKFGFLQLVKYRSAIDTLLHQLNIKSQDTEQPVSSLSGGNQQKVAMARLLHQQADILLLDEPTRGIDVVSKSQIFKWMGRLAAEGKALIFVSSYLPELLGVCDNIAVFHRGRLVDNRPAGDWDAHGIMAAATLGRKPEVEA